MTTHVISSPLSSPSGPSSSFPVGGVDAGVDADVEGASRVLSPGTEWLDVGGARIEAHAPGIVLDGVDGSYWWFGESAKTSVLTDHGVNCYHSTDLYSWTSVGQVISQAAIVVPNRTGPFTIERPKVLYHRATSSYVMWFHVDTSSYDVRRVGVAVSYNITAGFTFVRSFQPDGFPSLDLSVYEDVRDGEVKGAYLVRSVDNAYVGLSRLTDDYMDTSGLCSIIPEPREGHAIFHHQSHYYMLTSHLTGWAPNAMEAFQSSGDTLCTAEWRSMGNPTNDATSFNSQPALVLPYRSTLTNDTYLIYMGDRWSAPNLLNASYVWLPININQHDNTINITIQWRDKWDLDHPFNPTAPPSSSEHVNLDPSPAVTATSLWSRLVSQLSTGWRQ
jgi:hypothetical protein